MPKFLGKVEFPVTIEQGRGLEGAIANVTKLGYVDGAAGELNYYGYMSEEVCKNSTFEEVAFLLLFGHLPRRDELEAFQRKLRSSGTLPAQVKHVMQELPHDAHPMNVM